MINLKPLLSACLIAALSVQFAASAWAQTAPKKTNKPMVKQAAPSLRPVTGVQLVTTPLVSNSTLREVDYIVALVNSEPITRNEVSLRQRRLLAQWAAEGVSAPPEKELARRVLEQLIDERVMQQLAKESGVRVSDGQLDDALLNLAQQNQLSHVAALKAKYEADGGNWNSYREEVRSELIRMQLREREVDAAVRVSEAEIDRAMQIQDISPVGAQVSQDINLAHILIALPDNPSAEQLAKAKQKAADVVAQLRAGADFAKLAVQVSDGGDKDKGAQMGLRPVDRYPALFAEATKNLQVGQISEVQRSGAGFHILKVVERQASRTTPTVMQSHVRHILLALTDKVTEAQAKRQLGHFKTQIESGRASFASVARDYSVDGSAAQGGDLGWVTPGLFVPEFERVMNALPIGKLSEPFTSRFGVHLVEVTERKQVAISPREQRELMRAQLREKKAAEAYVLWMADARGRAFIEYKNVAP